MSAALATYIATKNRLIADQNLNGTDNSAEIAGMDNVIAAQERRIDELSERIDNAINGAARRLASKIEREAMANMREALNEALNEARAFDQEVSEQFEAGKIDEEARLKARQENWANFIDKIKQTTDEKLTPLRAELNSLTQSLASGMGTEEEIRKWTAQRDAVIAAMAQIAQAGFKMATEVQEDIDSISLENIFQSGKDGDADDVLDQFESKAEQAAQKLAGLRAELVDAGTDSAKFQALLKEKGWVDEESWPAGMRDIILRIIELLKQVDEATVEVEKKRMLESSLNTVQKALGRTREEAEMYREAVQGSMTELPNDQVRKFRRMLEGVGEQLRQANVDMTEFNRLRDELLKEAQDVNVLQRVLEINGELEEIQMSQATTARERFDIEMQILEAQYERLIAMNAESEHLDLLKEKMEQLRDAKEEAFRNDQGLLKWARENEDAMGKLSQAAGGFADQFSNVLVDGLETGKFAFKEFIKQLLKDILRIMIRAMIARAILASMGMAGPIEVQGIDMGAFDISGPVLSAMGNVVGPDGAMPLQRYARGGIATKPQIAVFGEGSMNEAYVPLPDGRSIPVTMAGSDRPAHANVEVNVINESGTPVEAEQQGAANFDGEKYVLDVVLHAVQRPGGFRDGMKGAMK